MSNKIPNYVQGEWRTYADESLPQYNAITGELIGTVGQEGFNYGEVLDYGRKVGGPALRKMTFFERGLMLKKLALYLHGIRKSYYPLSYMTGATKTDSWIDIDGGIGTLFAYASLRKKFPNESYHIDGETVGLSKGGTFVAQHIMVPKPGVAVHINAFNFPIWGMLEKISVNLLAGMPAVVKPSELTSFLAQAMVKDIVESGILPEGSLQILCGSGVGLIDDVNSQDVVTFTGSASTGRMLKSMPHIINNAVPFNMEADSLNAAVLGTDVLAGSEEFDLFIKEVKREMTVKAGQKCTAIRRIIVPENMVTPVQEALIDKLKRTTIGDPQVEGVRMGALVSKSQVEEVKKQVEKLAQDSELVFGNINTVALTGASAEKGAFISPLLFVNPEPTKRLSTHQEEAFGPVSSILPYKDLEEAVTIANLGKGSLVSTVCTRDADIAKTYVIGSAAYHGRILILNRDSAPESTGHGSPMPLLSHGGPGRAGGGEEMGGMRGVKHYLQRTALQGDPTMLSKVTNVFQIGSKLEETLIHPFRKHFEELQIGEAWITAKHTVTETDIVNFANVSGDHFYAHVDITSLEGTIFEKRVAHGYYLLSKAAGLFVEAKKGPVLLNYGIDECRFTKPVYPGTTIGVKLIVKEKLEQEKREDTDIGKGIVKWVVEIYDEENETVMLATILTMVKKLDQR